jgi:hypothetical protein
MLFGVKQSAVSQVSINQMCTKHGNESPALSRTQQVAGMSNVKFHDWHVQHLEDLKL